MAENHHRYAAADFALVFDCSLLYFAESSYLVRKLLKHKLRIFCGIYFHRLSIIYYRFLFHFSYLWSPGPS